MNLQDIIEALRACSDQIDSALVCSEDSQGDIKEWLMCALALLSQNYDTNSDEDKDLLSNDPDGYRQKAFKKAISLTLDAIKNEKSIEAFFSEVSVGTKDYSLIGIKHLVESYLKYHKAEWKSVESAIKNENAESLSGYIKNFVVCLIDKKSDFISALEERHSSVSLSETEILDWCCVVFAVYNSTPEAVSSFISDALGRYFDRWKISGTNEYFPYSMDETSHVEGQTGDDWKNLKKRIQELEEEYLQKIKVDRYVYYNGTPYKVGNTAYKYDESKNIKESSTGNLFKIGKSGKYLNTDNPDEVDSWYRKPDDSEKKFEETFDVQHYSSTGTYSSIVGGKGSPDIINYVFSNLKKENKISGREDFVKYGLGIDCSGFVSRAIVDVMITLKVPVYKQFKTIGHGYGRLKTNASTLRSEGSELLFLYRPDDSKSKKLNEDPRPDYQDHLRPGDIIMRKEIIPDGDKYKETERPFHILIIKDVSEKSFEVWNSKSEDSEGPRSDIYSGIDDFLERQKYTLKKLKNGHELIVDITRPNIFYDLNYLIPYYLEYLEGGEW